MNYDKAVNRMMGYMRTIYPMQRMINTPGIEEAFEVLKKEYASLFVHEYEAGNEYEDWVVPFRWSVRYGRMSDENGDVLLSTDDNILFVCAFSEAVDGFFDKEEIGKHALIHPVHDNLFMFEHRLAFNTERREWRISLPRRVFDSLDSRRKYRIEIDVCEENLPMLVGEWHIEGDSEETVVIAAHIDEQLCNDDLSGSMAALELMRYIESLPHRKYSYKLLLFPETLGSFVYLHENVAESEKFLFMLNLEMLGAGDAWCLKHSMNPESYFDRALKAAFEEVGVEYRELGFFEGYENDERSFAWPTFSIPGVGIQRHPFRYYHTEMDNPDIIDENYMREGLRIAVSFIDILEKDFVPKYLLKIPPKLSKRGLYYDSVEEKEKFGRFNNLLLFNIDGRKSLVDLARTSGLGFGEIHSYLEKFRREKLIDVTEFRIEKERSE